MEAERVTSLIQFFNSGLKVSSDCPAIKFDDGHTISVMNYSAVNEEAERISSRLKILEVEDEVICASSMKHVSVLSIIISILKVPAAVAFVDFQGIPSDILGTLNNFGSKYIFIQENEIEHFRSIFVNPKKVWETESCSGKLFLFELIEVERKKYLYEDWNLAYIIQTSGSTGIPKTVKVPHRCIIPNILHMRNLYKVVSDDVIFIASPLTFDPYVVDLFMALSCGACILLIPDQLKFVPKAFFEIIFKRNSVTMIQITPTLLKNMQSDEIQKSMLGPDSSLRILGLGGERCPDISTLLTWKSPLNKTEIYNVYGITEVSCWATIYHINLEKEFENEIPLGEPISGTDIQVIDAEGQIIKSGLGHLYVGGSERVCFINWEDASEATKAPMRATGDLVRLNEDGQIFFIERLDDIVKRYGIRISLNQIIKAANSLPEIETSYALFHEEKCQIILFIIIKRVYHVKSASVKNKLKEHLLRSIPKGSMPDRIVIIDYLPVTSHGKIDQSTLLTMIYSDDVSNDKGYISIYKKVEEFWKVRLSITHQISPSSNLISLGGDSLIAISISEEIKVWLGIECPLLLEKLISEKLYKICQYLDDLNRNEKHTATICSQKCIHEHNVEVGSCILCIENITSVDYGSVCRISRGNTHTGLKIIEASNQFCATKKGHLLHGFDFCWKYNTKKCVDASPLVICTSQDETVYIGSHSHVFSAISLETGCEKWVFHTEDRIESSACASPCGKKVFFGSYDCHLYCLNTDNGNQLWKFKAQGMIKSSPVVDEITSFVYFGSYDHYIYALMSDTGSCTWKCELGSGSIFSSPCIVPAPHHLYVGTLDGSLVALHPVSGHILWKNKLRAPIFSSCSVIPQGLCIGCVDNCFYAFDHDGNKLWTFAVDGAIFSSPCVAQVNCDADGFPLVVFGAHDRHIYCLSAATGLMQWKTQLSSTVYSTPFIHNINVANSKSSSYVFVCSTSGTLYALSLNEGSLCAEYQFTGEIFSSPVLVRNKIVVGCRDNNVYCLKTITH